jgi:hypothetical protein
VALVSAFDGDAEPRVGVADGWLTGDALAVVEVALGEDPESCVRAPVDFGSFVVVGVVDAWFYRRRRERSI